jgi:hypothetical protein
MRRQIMQGLLIQFKNQEHSGFCVENRLWEVEVEAGGEEQGSDSRRRWERLVLRPGSGPSLDEFWGMDGM